MKTIRYSENPFTSDLIVKTKNKRVKVTNSAQINDDVWVLPHIRGKSAMRSNLIHCQQIHTLLLLKTLLSQNDNQHKTF